MVPRMSPSAPVLRFVAAFSILALAGCGDSTDPTAPDASRSLGTDPTAGSQGQGAGRGRFIVTLQERETPSAVASAHGIRPEHVYTHVLNGFAGEISEAARSGLLRDARVVRVEQDQQVTVADVQPAASWGLDRIDQRAAARDGLYTYERTGAGVTVYVIDSGIRYSHQDFEGRASAGFDAFGGDGSDCYGHGTHVAGIIGGTTYGVAKDVSLVSVKVLDFNGFGSVSGVLAGMDWVASHRVPASVVNLSLGTGASVSLDNGASSLIAAGIPTVVAAGNAGADACKSSPARVKEAITVGATTSSDARASFSNWGRCVDWFAPGQSVTSAYYRSDSDSRSMSGTSMAAPHTSGVAALYLESAPAATPAQVAEVLFAWTTKGVVTDANTKDNHLLYSLGDGTQDWTPLNQPPVAGFAAGCQEQTCSFTDLSVDADGAVVSWRWDLGDGSGSSERNPTHSYAQSGSYVVSLKVTDDGGARGEASKTVSTSGPPIDESIQLDALAFKMKGQHVVELSWTGATGSSVRLFRDGELVASPPNSGSFSDSPGGRGRSTYLYQVCESATAICSAEVAVTF